MEEARKAVMEAAEGINANIGIATLTAATPW